MKDEAGRMRVGRIGRWLTLRYALGELLLIVTGVLIALAASDWQQGRQDRRAERAVLRELITALEGDLSQLEATLQEFEGIVSRCEALELHLQAGLPYADSLDANFGAVYGAVFRTRFNVAA